ncbi:MAG: acetyl-CoA carboxylase biotin carboxyl carrier protein subunit [Beijerinckiaceae bacterium]
MPKVNIDSEVAGTIWKIMVEVGQIVSQDDLILIVESMKMEIPVTAPAKGKIIEIQVAEGELITHEQLLVVLES